MYVRAAIEEGVREGAIVVPQQAVTRDNKGQAIAMVVGADNMVETRQLKTARTLGSDWLIDSGLRPGERVIVEGTQRARPGAPVKAIEASGTNKSASPAATAAPAPAPRSADDKSPRS
jgi:membrane fusion protein (multidrug efflux system)